MSSYITTHNANGQACFSTKVPVEQYQIPMLPDEPEKAFRQIIYDVDTLKPNLSTEADIDAYAERRTKGYADGTIGPENGFAFGVVTMAAGTSSPWHRTMTLDAMIILEGEVELHLDSGEMKLVRAGDTVVQRGSMHKWINVTPNGGAVKIAAIAQPIVAPINVGDKKLDTEWRF